MKVPLALDAAACTDLPVPVSTARASKTPLIGLSAVLMKFSAWMSLNRASTVEVGTSFLASILIEPANFPWVKPKASGLRLSTAFSTLIWVSRLVSGKSRDFTVAAL